jgi:hypothetical protein
MRHIVKSTLPVAGSRTPLQVFHNAMKFSDFNAANFSFGGTLFRDDEDAQLNQIPPPIPMGVSLCDWLP